MNAIVESVSRSATHSFSKPIQSAIELVVGLGVVGDAHLGPTVKHRSRVRRSPAAPNLRQVHLMHGELHDDLNGRGFTVQPGEMGENITTRGLDLLALPAGTRLQLGDSALIEVTGLRNPCVQLDRFQDGLMHAVLDHDPAGNLVRKAGVMAIVLASGTVRPGDPITVTLPPEPHHPLKPV